MVDYLVKVRNRKIPHPILLNLLFDLISDMNYDRLVVTFDRQVLGVFDENECLEAHVIQFGGCRTIQYEIV